MSPSVGTILFRDGSLRFTADATDQLPERALAPHPSGNGRD